MRFEPSRRPGSKVWRPRHGRQNLEVRPQAPQRQRSIVSTRSIRSFSQAPVRLTIRHTPSLLSSRSKKQNNDCRSNSCPSRMMRLQRIVAHRHDAESVSQSSPSRACLQRISKPAISCSSFKVDRAVFDRVTSLDAVAVLEGHGSWHRSCRFAGVENESFRRQDA